MKVVVTTAVELSKSQLATLTKELTNKYGKKTTVETVVDPSVIGGVSLTIGSKHLDGTVKRKLDLIKKQLHTRL